MAFIKRILKSSQNLGDQIQDMKLDIMPCCVAENSTEYATDTMTEH